MRFFTPLRMTICLHVLCVCGVILPAYAQHDSTKARIDKEYITSYFKDIGHIAAAPLHFKTREWVGTGIVLGTTALISTQDDALHDFFQRNRSTTSDQLSKYVFEPFGSGVYTAPLLALIYFNGVFTKNEKSKAVAMMATKAFAVTGIYAQLTKHLVHRYRPYQVYDNPAVLQSSTPPQYHIMGPFKGFGYVSFPSGHTISAFSVATIIASAYKDVPYLPLAAYAVAAGTGLSRINDNKHWASDVFMGAVLGYALGKFIYIENTWGISLLPYSNGGMLGASLNVPIR